MKIFWSKLLPYFLILISGILIGKYFFINNHDNSSKEIRKSFNYQFINPILECDSNIIPSKNLSTLKNKIEETINQEINSKNINFTAVYFRDLNNGPWFGINEKEYFTPASLVKVPVLIAYLKKAEKDPNILNQKIINPEKQDNGIEIQNVQPSSPIEVNQEYTIEELLTRMIIYSDNDAYNDLVRNINGDDLLQVYKDLDIDISKILTNPKGNILTVKDYASFFRILYNASYLNQGMSEKALLLLSQTEFKQALVAGIPGEIKVAHKFGERIYNDTQEVQLHDCGIIYLPQKPYLLCIMTRGDNLDKANNTIKKISQEVFQHINTKSN